MTIRSLLKLARPAVLPLLALIGPSALLGGCGPLDPGEEESQDDLSINFNISASGLSAADENLLLNYAPVHYQDVNKAEDSGKADYLSRFDYDGNWVANDNWDHLHSSTLSPQVYAKVVESGSHWFLYYMMYHPRDWVAGTAEEHEHDAEGVLMAVRKDGSTYGRLEAVLTQAHGPMGPYSARPEVVTRGGGLQQTVTFENDEGAVRPRSYQEAEGHGMYMCNLRHSWFPTIVMTKCDKGDEDGIRYVPRKYNIFSQPAAPGNVGVWTTVGYGLRTLDDLWNKRTGSGPGWDSTQIWKPIIHWPTFQITYDWNGFNGNDSGGCGDGLSTCALNSANPIWAWDGGKLRDPANYFNEKFEFRGVPAPTADYIRNDLR